MRFNIKILVTCLLCCVVLWFGNRQLAAQDVINGVYIDTDGNPLTGAELESAKVQKRQNIELGNAFEKAIKLGDQKRQNQGISQNPVKNNNRIPDESDLTAPEPKQLTKSSVTPASKSDPALVAYKTIGSIPANSATPDYVCQGYKIDLNFSKGKTGREAFIYYDSQGTPWTYAGYKQKYPGHDNPVVSLVNQGLVFDSICDYSTSEAPKGIQKKIDNAKNNLLKIKNLRDKYPLKSNEVNPYNQQYDTAKAYYEALELNGKKLFATAAEYKKLYDKRENWQGDESENPVSCQQIAQAYDAYQETANDFLMPSASITSNADSKTTKTETAETAVNSIKAETAVNDIKVNNLGPLSDK